MKNVISDKVLGLQPSGIRKFFDIVSEMDDVISLGVGEPDLDPEIDEKSEAETEAVALLSVLLCGFFL